MGKTLHGKYETRTNTIWNNMVQRCINPKNDKFKDYGGRGITIDSEWRLFKNFLNEMGEVPIQNTLGRIDNNKGYCKTNCRWETLKSQARNRRSSRFLEFRGTKKLLIEWAEEFGIKYATLYRRIRIGWSTEKALTTPLL